jgi:hypothetical protein
MKLTVLAVMLLCPLLARAQLLVRVISPKVIGEKTIVQIKMKNNLAETVKSARAVCFLMDEKGKMVGHVAKWVIGQNKEFLGPESKTTFNFVITSSLPFSTTNLAARVCFTRVVLADDKLANPNKDVIIINQ